jgi:hypothetical protein
MNLSPVLHFVRSGSLAATLGALLLSPLSLAQTAGSAKLTATIHDLEVDPSTEHYAVVWVTKADNTFITTLWKQGATSFDGSHWVKHFLTWNTQRNGSTTMPVAPDGYTSATATSYSATNPSPPASGIASNAITISWNGKDAGGTLQPDGQYKFWIEYAEDAGSHNTDTGGLTTGGLTWTKGPSASSINPTHASSVGTPTGGLNFTNMSIVWTPTVVPLPEIAVEQPLGTNLADAGSKDFGSVAVGSNASLTFTIKNTGSAALTGLTVSTDGSNPSDFALTSNPVAPVSGPSGTTTFAVTFNPGAAGTRSAAIHILNNDGNENPFDITLTGTGVVPATAVQTWRQSHFGSPDNSGAGADLNDFEKDGLPNLIEFAFGLNPKQDSAGLLPRPQRIGGNMVVSFSQPVGVSGITYGAEWGTSLLSGSWTAIADTGTPPQHSFSVPVGATTKLFMRMKVTNP